MVVLLFSITEAYAYHMKRFAVFDIDGTLIRWQLYHAVVDRLGKRNLLAPGAHEAIHQARMVWKNREYPEAFRAYEQTVIEAYESALPKLSVEDFDAIVTEVAAEFKGQVSRYTRELALDLKKQGYMLLAISGSHQELVQHICTQYDFDDCVGTQYKRADNHFTGEKIFVAGDKQSALKALIEKHNLTLEGSYAVGDSQSDAAMLELVENPVAFNPDQQLFDTARAKGWKIVIERKNVIYELDKQSGSYQLQ